MRISVCVSDVCSSDLGRSRPCSRRIQSLAGVLFHVPDRILLLQGLDLPYQRFNLCQEQRMGEDRPRSEERRVGKECVIRVNLGGRRINKKKNMTQPTHRRKKRKHNQKKTK